MCVIDPTTTAQPAMQRAAWFAGKTGAEIELFICYYKRVSERRTAVRFTVPRKGAQRDYQRPRQAPGNTGGTAAQFRPRCEDDRGVGYHPLYEGIVRHAAAVGADVILKDTHHHSAIARALLTNTDWNLIRACAAPLWLVKPRDVPAHPIFVAAVDPLHENDKPAALDDEILDICKTLADATGGELRAFHAYDPRMAIAGATASAYIPVSIPFEELEELVISDHKKQFAEVTARHNIDSAHAHLVAGLTHEELPEFCSNIDAAVVVMGAISRNRWKRLFIGATAERTLEHLPCDLLIVKPDWFRIPDEIAEDRTA